MNSHLIFTLQWRGLRLSRANIRLILSEYSKARSWAEFAAHTSCGPLSVFLKKHGHVKEWGLRDLEWCEKNNIRTIFFGSKEYPESFYQLERPPLVLTALGGVNNCDQLGLAIVGSRHPSPLTQRWLEQNVSEFLSRQPVPILSGGARGVDQKAHSIALRSGVPTYCFLPSGIGAPYPAELQKWFSTIVDGGGAIVSQFAPQSRVQRASFVFRNELIVAASRAVLVAEARRKSGSYMTGRLSFLLGKKIGVVPHHPMTGSGNGSLDLIHCGAEMIRDSSDLSIFWESGRGATLDSF